MPGFDSIVAQIRATLAATDPDLDTSTGTTTRKIIDAVAEPIAESYVEQHMLAYQYDVDSKIEADLDAFTQLFGIARLGSKRATGTVVFSRTGNTSRTVVIPVNTQIGSTTSPRVVVATVTPAVMGSGVSSVTVPVQAVVGGPQGNVAAGLLTQLLTPVAGLTSVSNVDAMTGGTEQETDSQLRDRWKKTAFRSLAGTEQMYLGIALNDSDVSSANVVGASKRRREQVQISGGTATSQIDDAGYIYPASSVVGENIDAGQVKLRDHDYTFAATNPPTITSIGAGLTNGTIYDLDFEYQPLASRNSPTTGITNRVDVWVNGIRAVAASQSMIYKADKLFTGSSSSPYYTNKFVRMDGSRPVAGNAFIPLAFGPILTLPTSLTINAVTYLLGTHYFIVHQDDAFGYSPYSLFGMEWVSTNFATNNAVFTVGTGYTYNAVPASVQQGINRWRLIGVDAMAHQAKQQRLKFNLAVMYESRVSQAVVNTAIDTALSRYLSRLGFASVVQASDVLQVVHNVPGVDNVRFLNGSDYAGYNSATPNAYAIAIQRVVNGVVVQTFADATSGRAKDAKFGDAEVPAFESATKVTKAQNTFGVA